MVSICGRNTSFSFLFALIGIISWPQFTLLALLPVIPLTIHLLLYFPSEKGKSPRYIKQVSVIPGTSPCVKTEQVNPVGEKGSPKQAKSQRQALLPLLGFPLEEQVIQPKVIRSVSWRLPGCWYSLCEPLWAQVSICCGLSLSPLTPINILPLHSQDSMNSA